MRTAFSDRISKALWDIAMRPTLPVWCTHPLYSKILAMNTAIKAQGARIKEIRLSYEDAWKLGREIGAFGYPTHVDGIKIVITGPIPSI